MPDRSTHPTVVEYGVHEMMKRKSPKAAAAITAKKLAGYENIFIGSGIVEIDAAALEMALWDRMVDFTISSMAKILPGKEHYALDGTVMHFGQKSSVRAELKRRVIAKLPCDPFVHDAEGGCPR